MKYQFAIVAGVLLLAACGPRPAQPAGTATTTATPPAATQADHPADATTYPADYRIDAPIAREDVATSLVLSGVPRYRAKDDMLLFDVAVSNNGKVPLVSAGKAPVRIAVTLAGPEGVDKAPGTRKFARAMLPLITPGSTGQIVVKVPVQPLLGLAVRAELVQEGVAWWSRGFKQPVLNVGVFQRCDGASNTVCDAAGAPVAAAGAPAARL
jgi:hypothetical protein